MVRLALAVLHLLALGIGMGAVWTRARLLRGGADPARLRAVFTADAWWGIASILWLVTGLARFFFGTEKSTAYYLANHLFHAKIGVFLLVFLLEMWPMATLMRWRRGLEPTDYKARLIRRISYAETALLVVIVTLAAAMARGYTGR